MDGSRHPFRIGFPAAASLAINALLIAALLNLGMGHRTKRMASPSLTVMSLAVLKGAEDGKEKESAKTPAAVSHNPSHQLSRDPILPAPSLPLPMSPILPFTSPRTLAMTAAASVQPSGQTAAASPPMFAAPADSAPPVRRGKADGLDVTAPAGTSYAYAARVRSWLYAHKVYPRRARMRREEGVVKVRFVIDRSGLLLEGAIIASSGEASLDQEANAMLQRSSPFPRAPSDISGDRIEFIAPIEFVLPV